MPPIEQESTLDEVLAAENAEDNQFPAADVPEDDIEVVVAGEDGESVDVVDPEAPGEPAAAAPEVGAAEATPAEPDALDAELEETDKAYPEPIKKRIKREIRIRKRVEAEFEQVRDAAIKVAQIAQDREQELKTARIEMQKLRRQHAEVLDVTFDKEIHIKQAVLRKARDDGDYDAEMKSQSEIDALRFQQNQVREARRSMGDDATPAAPPPAAAATHPAQPTAPAAPPPPQKAVKWIETNQTWMKNPQFAGHVQFVRGVDAQIKKEGYDVNSDEYYKELDRRIDEAFPTLRKAPVTSGSPVAPVSAQGARPAGAGKKRSITLTRADLDNMQRYGLDPSNKAHLQEYARNKVAA